MKGQNDESSHSVSEELNGDCGMAEMSGLFIPLYMVSILEQCKKLLEIDCQSSQKKRYQPTYLYRESKKSNQTKRAGLLTGLEYWICLQEIVLLCFLAWDLQSSGKQIGKFLLALQCTLGSVQSSDVHQRKL